LARIAPAKASRRPLPTGRLSRSSTYRRGADDLGTEEHPMLDLVLLALGLGLFALTVGYAFACDRL
jgi:hypothetical protein